MTVVQLKNIVGRRNASSKQLQSLIEEMKASVTIEDSEGALLYDGGGADSGRFPVNVDDYVIGWVMGDESARVIAGILSLIAGKESERKHLGNEVLSLYGEVNRIFNFSEKLAKSVGAFAIAEATLEEVKRSIGYDRAVVVLWNESTSQLEVMASDGELLVSNELLKGKSLLLFKDNQILWNNMKSAALSRDDLIESLRLETKQEDFGMIETAHLETNGRISFIMKSGKI